MRKVGVVLDPCWLDIGWPLIASARGSPTRKRRGVRLAANVYSLTLNQRRASLAAIRDLGALDRGAVGIVVVDGLLLLAAVGRGLAGLACGEGRGGRGGVRGRRVGRAGRRRLSEEAGRAATEDAVGVADLSLATSGGAGAGRGRGRGRALDVVVEALDDVAGARLLEVCRLDAEDVVLELLLEGCQRVVLMSTCTSMSTSSPCRRTRLLSTRRFFCSDSRKSRRRRS
jgi:hypothetical protein